ncbi:MAG: xanthine dehydrogenase family protein subunit M [Pseudomonadales bacterium]
MPAHDVMPDIELFQPLQVEDAASIAARLGADGWLVAGGQDTYGWLKDRAKVVKALIDLSGIDSLKGVRESGDGIEIGALTTLTEVARDPLIRARYPLLAEAASHVASPQIRNVGTLGGNVCQDARCWYYRRGLNCYRAGGNICYADTPQGMNREHCVFGASRCVAVSPSDTAPALVALEATMVIQSPSGQRTLSAEDFFVGPDVDIVDLTVLEPGEVLTAVRLPGKWAGAAWSFEKVADRNVWDFALVSLAAVFRETGGSIDEARLVSGAVAAVPWRLKGVERALVGQPRTAATGDAVANLASRGGEPLNHNAFKLPLLENLVRRALRA